MFVSYAIVNLIFICLVLFWTLQCILISRHTGQLFWVGLVTKQYFDCPKKTDHLKSNPNKEL